MINHDTNYYQELFDTYCTVFEMKKEYPSHIGSEKYGIITALSEKELEDMFGNFLFQFKPFVLLPTIYDEIRSDYNRNENKHYMRIARGSQFGIDDDFEEHHPECMTETTEDTFIENFQKEQLMKALTYVSQKQRTRIYAHFFLGKSCRQIAINEGIHTSSVIESIEGGLKKMRKYFE